MKKLKVLIVGAFNIFNSKSTSEVDINFTSFHDFDGQKLSFKDNNGNSSEPDVILLIQLDNAGNLASKILSDLFIKKLKSLILYDKLTVTNKEVLNYLSKKSAISIDVSDNDSLDTYLLQYFFGGQEGSKLSANNVISNAVNSNSIVKCGNVWTEYELENTLNFENLHSWRYNYVFQKNKIIELWLEYELVGTAEIMLYLVRIGHDGQIIENITELREDLLNKPYIIENFEPGEFLFCSLFAKGTGKVRVGQLHIRRSRGRLGTFFIGGKRIVSDSHQELMYYFNPGDMKPPLNVYFSGYRSAEGFEGNFMMRDLDAPYVLITDPRIEGGSFYIGSEQLELGVVSAIQDSLKELNFTKKDLILSGLSMGTFGALYYASMLSPHAVVIGKPLVNIGNVSLNERSLRPEGFPTSLDVLYNIVGGNNYEAVQKLNEKFWTKFNSGDLSETKFSISYMQDDDYDRTAFPDIQKSLKKQKSVIISKGFVGRHNDNSFAINNWFIKQFRNILKYDFGRE